jgi:serine/threonine protein kinase
VLALHVSGKLHRDLKPSNVLVTGEGRVVLLDFGLVSDVETQRVDLTHDQAAVGTPAYMSPEQAADQPLTEASDWYAVGVMLYEALTGRRPFDGSAEQMMRRKQRETPLPPSVIDSSWPRSEPRRRGPRSTSSAR